jgi:DNA-damage-inducible protein J
MYPPKKTLEFQGVESPDHEFCRGVTLMGDTTSMNLRIDKDLKKQAETLFAGLGLNMTTAINIFLKQAVREQGIPFAITAHKDYESVSAYKGSAERYGHYAEYIASSLKEADDKVAKGTMKYYTADEIRSKLEDILNEKI